MKEKLQQIIKKAESELNSIVKKHELLNAKSQIVGKKSELNSLMKNIKDVAPEERREFGQLVNEAKDYLQDLIDKRNQYIDELVYKEQIESSRLDLTMPEEELFKVACTLSPKSGEKWKTPLLVWDLKLLMAMMWKMSFTTLML